jgi:hypothetical protein
MVSELGQLITVPVSAKSLGMYVVAQFGDVVAQWLSPLGDTRLSRSSPEFEYGFPHSLPNWTGSWNMTVCYKTNLRVGGVPAWVKNKKKPNLKVCFTQHQGYRYRYCIKKSKHP